MHQIRVDQHCYCRWFVIVLLLVVFCCPPTANHVVAFPSSRPTRKRTGPNTFLSLSLPTVINPLTKRKITVGGPTYNDLLREGKWVQQDGTLQRLDLALLRSYQEERDLKEDCTNTETTALTKGNFDVISTANITATADEWYPILPKPIFLATKEDSNVRKGGSILPQDQQEMLQKELIFVHKPSGLHCVPPRDVTQPSLATTIQHTYGATAKTCHRLDRDTSGIVLFGLSPDAHTAISRQFEDRTTSKTYLALVAGHPAEDCGTVDLAIGKQKTPEGFHRWATLSTGDNDSDTDADILKPREAITKWKVQERFTVEGARFARVELEPQTGRGHQLRLHMKAIGHPLLGDTLHAPDAVAHCAPRLCLHAYRLQVDWNGLRLEATSVAPF